MQRHALPEDAPLTGGVASPADPVVPALAHAIEDVPAREADGSVSEGPSEDSVVSDDPYDPLRAPLWISTSAGSKRQRIHVAAGCYRIPGQHVRYWGYAQDLEQVPPGPALHGLLEADLRRCGAPSLGRR